MALFAGGIAPKATASECPNEALRVGASASLPDCRAYELVSPPDSDGRWFQSLWDSGFLNSSNMFPSDLITRSGDSVIFTTTNAPLGAAGATGTLDLYQVTRSAEGWRLARRLTPSGPESIRPLPGGVSADHRYAFVYVEPPFDGRPSGTLASNGAADYFGSPDGSFELTGIGSVGGVAVSERLSQGRYISEGAEHVLFSTGQLKSGSLNCFEAIASADPCPVRRLADNAPPEGTGAVYDRSADGATKVVSLLPGPSDPTPGIGEDAAYQGASEDGATVAFKIGATMFLRVPDDLDGHTLEVTGGDPVFAGLSSGGRYLFYVAGGQKGTIHRFDASDETDVAVNPAAEGEIVNISADGSNVYFISESEIGGHGNAGSPNLYVWSGGGAPEFIATVAANDLISTSGIEGSYPNLTNWTDWAVTPFRSNSEVGPGGDSSRTTPDGDVLVFESKEEITPFENAGHTEIYRWDDVAKSLDCISCNPNVEPGTGDAQLQNVDLVRPPIALHNVSDDGSRVFFETTEALAPIDDDKVNDIYEWQQGSLELPKLISSGHSIEVQTLHSQVQLQPAPNVIFAITPDSTNVVFLSQDELVPGAGSGGSPALYDARVNGGFPLPALPTICLREDCKPGPSGSLLSLAGASSEATSGAGNVKPKKKLHKRHCKRRKGHRRCVKKSRAHKSSTQAAYQGEAGESQGAQPPTSGAVGEVDHGAANSEAPVALAGGEFEGFAIEEASAEVTTTSAGGHPDFTTFFSLPRFINGVGQPEADARVEEVSVSLPPGLLGNPNAVSKCKTREFLAFGNCPTSSQVGVTTVLIGGLGKAKLTEPVFNLEPVHLEREIARFGIYAGFVPVFIDVKVRTASDYGATAIIHRSPGQAPLIEAKTTLWGSPTDPVHDPQRLNADEALHCYATATACEAENHKRSVLPAPAFMTNPSACQDGSVGFAVRSYQLPGELFTATAPLEPIGDCSGLPFAPSFSAEPTSPVAGAPTGLHTKLVLPQHLEPGELGTSTMREARVTLPAGMQVAAGAANWIGTCSDAQVGYHEEVDAACPDNSKLGTVTIVSPALSTPIEGSVYQRTPRPGHQFGLWLTADALGLHVKLPGDLEPDPQTGRLTAVFRDLPQVPVEEIELDVFGGPRAPLQNPDHCGTYAADFSFSPHSNDPAVVGHTDMQITEGCNQGFDPSLRAGVTNPVAGAFSPFVFDLTRGDGQQALRGFELRLPDGELAKLAGVPLCSDAAASAGNCPAGSRIGSLQATTGPGPEPLAIPQPGKPQPAIYLAGPYQDAPFSIVSEVPAQAGPFDLGVLVVRSGLNVEPETGRAVVKADPLPQFFEGVGIAYRQLHALVDRPEFNINPTDCRETRVTAEVFSTSGTVAHPAARFQVDGCEALGFKPELTLKLKGGTKRTDYPALTAILKARKGDANIASTSVALPHSEFLAQEHIGTICTRKQFAVDQCPKKSVYGKAKAITPLLDEPLSGSVYLRSSDHPLPDLVVKLDGKLEIDLVGRIDSTNGGIRTTFESVPDAPVSKFVLRMKGGTKGLLINSTDICRRAHRATVAMRAQNGRTVTLRQPLQSSGCSKKYLKHKKHR
ncbi:MAG TPA: hypothetical protein VFX35_09040 [Solirubrobacterales bacterium]|nr:hypothetical protein [Solirubrobacterales bacterium]